MSTEIASPFFAVLALSCVAAVVAAVVVAAVRLRHPDRLAGLRADIGRGAVPLALVVAATATAGSLYYSEVAGFEPCALCWYQRIFMYSAAVVLAVGVVRRDAGVRFYALPLALAGAAVSAYHAWIQAFPSEDSPFCTLDAPCTARHVWEFGFVSLPFMALTGFLFVVTMMAFARPVGPGGAHPVGPGRARPVGAGRNSATETGSFESPDLTTQPEPTHRADLVGRVSEGANSR